MATRQWIGDVNCPGAAAQAPRPTGGGKGGVATCNDGVDESDRVDAWRSIGLNGVMVIDSSGLTNEDFLPRVRLCASKVAPIASKALTPMVPPVIVPACEYESGEAPIVTGLPVIYRTGTLRYGKSAIENRRLP